MVNSSKIKTHHKHLIFASIAITFFLGGIMVLATKFKVFANTDYLIQNNIINTTKDYINIEDEIIDFVATDSNSQHIQNLLDQEEYDQALQRIVGEKSEDYFNRGVIFLTQAIQQSKSTQVDTLQEAKYLAEKAIHNFEIAQKLQLNNKLIQTIQTNINTAEQIHNFNTFKFCFAGNETLLDKLSLFTNDSELILNLLQAEETYIKDNKTMLNNISNTCKYKLTKINKENQKQISKLKNILNIYQEQYTEKYFKTLQDPNICNDNNLDQTLGSLGSTQKTIQKYKTDHMQTLKALQEKDEAYISKLCQDTKNDSQLQNNVSDALQDFLKNLQKELETGNQDKDQNQEQQHRENTEGSHTNINTIDAYIQTQIQEKNLKRIQKIQEIKKQDYNPLKQLQSLFKEFYGNTDNYQDYEDKKQEYNKF